MLRLLWINVVSGFTEMGNKAAVILSLDSLANASLVTLLTRACAAPIAIDLIRFFSVCVFSGSFRSKRRRSNHLCDR